VKCVDFTRCQPWISISHIISTTLVKLPIKHHLTFPLKLKGLQIMFSLHCVALNRSKHQPWVFFSSFILSYRTLNHHKMKPMNGPSICLFVRNVCPTILSVGHLTFLTLGHIDTDTSLRPITRQNTVVANVSGCCQRLRDFRVTM